MRKLRSALAILLVASMLLAAIPAYATETPAIIVESVEAKPGDTVDVKIAVKNNPGITSLKLKAAFDSDLTLQTVTYNTDIGGRFMQPQTKTSPVTMNWFEGAQDVTGDWTWATLTFQVSETATVSAHAVTVTYNQADVYNINDDDVVFAVENGGVTVKENSSEPDPTEGAKIYAGEAKVKPSKEFALKLNISDNPGIAEVLFRLGYDSDKFTLLSVEDAGLLKGFTEGESIDDNPYFLLWSNASDAAGDGLFVTLTFLCHDDVADGDYTFDLQLEEAYNQNFDDVAINITVPSVKVKNYVPGDINEDGVINGKDSILLKQYLAKWKVTIGMDAADVNRDGVINGKDSILLCQYLARWDVVLK